MTYIYKPTGVCTQVMEIDIENGIITDARFEQGCNGNLQGISALVKGRDAREIQSLLEGVRCGLKQTSCPDQLSRALKIAISQEEKKSR